MGITLDVSWKNFYDRKPPGEGRYLWKLQHRFIKDAVLIFDAKYRNRNAGYEIVLSPEFSFWNGYNLILPPGPISWRHYIGQFPVLEVVGVDLLSCPFCKEAPAWDYSGGFITPTPIDAEYFYLRCCRWINKSYTEQLNPIKAAELWNNAVSK